MQRKLAKVISLLTAIMMSMALIPTLALGAEDAGDSDIELTSLLPLEEVDAKLDLSKELPASLKNIKVSDVISKLEDEEGNPIQIDPAATTVWEEVLDENGDWEYDKWNVLGMDDTMNMLAAYSYDYSTSMQLIVGSGNQLDPDNIRYIVNVFLPDLRGVYNIDLYEQTVSEGTDGADGETVRSKIPARIVKSRMGQIQEDNTYKYIPYYYLSVGPKYSADNDYYMNISLNESLYPGYTIKVYSGLYDTAEEAIAAAEADGTIDITDKITNQDMTKADAGYKNKWADWSAMKDLTVVYFKDGNAIYADSFELGVNPRENNIYNRGLSTTDDNGNTQYVGAYSSSRYDYKDDGSGAYVEVITYTLKSEYPTDAEYSFCMYGYNGETEEQDASFVKKAVVGHYDSLEAAEEQSDIKDQLFGESGYKANFSGEGVDITVFAEDQYWQFTIIAADNEVEPEQQPDDAPPVGSSDRYFRVTDICDKDGNELRDSESYGSLAYVVPYEHDTYYSNGYQAVLINDKDVDLTALRPKVYLGENAKVYHDGVLEETTGSYGQILTSQDFTAVPSDLAKDPRNSVKYTVSAENHIDQKNYHLTVVKKTADAQLFVNGPDEREIFLNDYYDNIHDIFIANLGEQQLTGIKAELVDAQNVKLDNYWTVGGDGNDTLAPFTTTSTTFDTYHGELANVAKIRLIPDGEGDISGTLKISADGQETREIKLTGRAGNPKIDTEELRTAVKYVPYQSIITTNNMHDWNKVTFSLYSGKLPEGVTLMPSGELYGVPKTQGDFPIKVRAQYSYSQFSSSIASFTLSVLNNTNENVDAQTDEGYEIITRVPDSRTDYSEQVFEFEYDYAEHSDEFQGFWLDGEKLIKDEDYTVDAGSTKITIRAQTMSSAGAGTHTIAAEYRSKSTNEVKKAAQNYTRGSSSGSGGSGGGGTGGGGSYPSSYKVWFEVNGGAWLDEITVKRGQVANLPTPERAGFIFDGWYTDKALTKPYDTNKKVTSTVTLYAKWIEEYTIWFIENGGEPLEDIHVKSGDTAPELPTPERAGAIFDGWYKDEALTQKYDPSEPVMQSMSLYAKWLDDVPPEGASGFRDVNETNWFYSDVDWIYGKGLMVGTSNITFEPNTNITGGMVVTVLARLANVNVDDYAQTTFDDVFEGEWYTPYAKWAKAVGLVDGIPFNPPTVISREWVGIVLTRYLDYMGVKYELNDGEVHFTDEADISPEARVPLQTLFKLGIFKGRGENIIDPQSFTTRAEFAALIRRLDDCVNK